MFYFGKREKHQASQRPVNITGINELWLKPMHENDTNMTPERFLTFGRTLETAYLLLNINLL